MSLIYMGKPIQIVTIIICTIIIGMTVCLPNLAIADANQQNIARAQDLVRQGKSKFRKKKYLEGIKLYQQAHQVFPDIKNLYMIARAYSSLSTQYCQQSIEAWNSFLKSCTRCKWKKSGVTIQKSQRSRCYVEVQFQTSPPKSHVQYQGESWGYTPFKKRMLVGEYKQITIKSKKYWPQEIDLSLKENQKTKSINLTLLKKETDWLAKNKTLLASVSMGMSLSLLSIGIWQYLKAQDASDQAATALNEYNALNLSEQTTAYTGLQSQLQSLESEMKSSQITGITLIGTALVIGGVSTWLWSYQSNTKTSKSASQSYRSSWTISPLSAQWRVDF